VLVPQSFIDYGNKVYGRGAVSVPSRLIVKTKDPSDKAFVQYLQQRDYTTNLEQLRWSKLRAVVEVISGATGVLAILLMGIGTLVFILFIELTIARAQQSISLLLQIGYSPHYLSRFMIKRFLPLVFVTAIVSMILAAVAQAVSSVAIKDLNLQLSFFPGWPVWGALLVSTLILFALVGNSISRAIKNHS